MVKTKPAPTYVIASLFLFAQLVSADVGFTKDDLELVKDACLAGSSFDFKTEADGSISVRNLEGKGKLSISKKDVTTVDLPDSDKSEEFKEIRSCIKDYLIKNKPKNPDEDPQGDSGVLPSGSIAAQCGCWGYVTFGQVGPSQVCASGKEVAFPCTGFCPGGGNSWGTRCI
ncbi:MAG: hypothetical protein ACYDC8_13890 [Gammaproteobacteria bacterium]